MPFFFSGGKMNFFKVLILLVSILFVEARYLRRHYMDDEIFGDDGLNFQNKDEKNILILPREKNETDYRNTFEKDIFNFPVKNETQLNVQKEKYILTLPRERNETDNDYSKKLQINFVLYLEYNEGKMQCMSTSKPNNICILNITINHDEEYQ